MNILKNKVNMLDISYILAILSAPYYYLRYGGSDFSVGTSFSLVDVFLFICFVGALCRSFRVGNVKDRLRYLKPLLITGVIFTVVAFASIATSYYIYSDEIETNIKTIISSTIQYGFVLLALPLIVNTYTSYRTQSQLLRLLAIAYFPIMFLTVVFTSRSFWPDLHYYFFPTQRAIGTFGNANVFAGIICMAFPYYAYLISLSERKWQVLGYIGCIFACLCLCLTLSFGGILVFLSVVIFNLLLLFFWKGHPARMKKGVFFKHTLGVILLFIASLPLLYAYAPITAKIVERRFSWSSPPPIEDPNFSAWNTEIHFNNLGSLRQRLGLIKMGFELVGERNGGVFYGHGLNQTPEYLESHFNSIPLAIHLTYLLMWVEGGLLLMLAFIFYLVLLLKNCILLSREHPKEALTIVSVLASFGALGMVSPHLYLRYFWVLLLPAFLMKSVSDRTVTSDDKAI